MDLKMLEKANQILKKTSNVHLGVVNEKGCPVVMVMSLINPECISEIYLSTTLDSNKAKSLQKNNKASVCISTTTYNITLTGEAEILTDQETKSKCWQNWFVEVYPDGETDPNYCIIKFTAKHASLCIDHEVTVFEMSKA
ncbi:MAG: pyridoxamine 5'-phosphate oxidase family protein [Defluviitaleaceae bacterium]|nr:pyridoxamine 5'-phosphate oxidase family protein [Defluviitaleaceae bacterium]